MSLDIRAVLADRRFVLLTCLGLMGCGASNTESIDATSDKGGDDLSALKLGNGDLGVGAQGAEVRSVTAYLSRFGFFPNRALSEHYPQWRPAVSAMPDRDDVYDLNTEQAVRAFQHTFHLPESGIVDATTRSAMLEPRCGDPESPSFDNSNKFDPGGSDSSTSNLTWQLLNTNAGVSRSAGEAAISSALSGFYHNRHTFSKSTSGTADITIRFALIDPATLATWDPSINARSAGNEIYLNVSSRTWSTALPGPAGAMDFQAIVVHELGHRLGYNHTGISAPYAGGTETLSNARPVMYPSMGANTPRRNLQSDDVMSELAKSGVNWEEFDNDGEGDIDVDSGPTFQTITVTANPTLPGGKAVWQLYNGAWTQLGTIGAVRVGGNGGTPWIVQDNGNIYRWVGSWSLVPGCATDIGVGGDNSVWIIGCNAVAGGYRIYKYNGSTFDEASGGGGGVRISVGPSTPGGVNVPWIVNSTGFVFRRNSASVSTGTWITLPGGGILGTDIAVGASGFAWLIGKDVQPGGHSIYLWNEQPTVAGGPPATALAQWRLVAGGAVNVSTDNNSEPFVVNSGGHAFYGW